MTLPTSPPSGLHVRHEKAGQVYDALPVPWNADAVIIEANVRLGSAQRDKRDFTLKLPGEAAPLAAEIILEPKKPVPARVFFRISVPGESCSAEVFWRAQSLGKAEIPVIARTDYLRGLELRMAGLHLGVKGGRTAPCRAFVSGQCQTLHAAAVIAAPHPLAPLADLDFHITIQHGDEPGDSIPIALGSEQMRGRQALVIAGLPKLRLLGEYAVSWRIGAGELHRERLRLVSRKHFLRSLRISATRFIMSNDDGGMEVVRWLPQKDGRPSLAGGVRVAPCFFVRSGETGLTGLAGLTVRAVFMDGTDKTLAASDILLTDGPTPFLPTTLDADQLVWVKHFTLESSAGALGNLPLVPAPSAALTAEGGFAGADDFLWSAAAEEQLNDRLAKLLGGG